MSSLSTSEPVPAVAGVAPAAVPPSHEPRGRRRDRSAWSGRWRRWGISATALLGALLIWEVVTRLQIWSPVFVPPPEAVWDRFWQISGTHDGIRGFSGFTVWEHLAASVRRILVGSTIGVALGIGAGLLIGSIPVVRHAFEPFLTFLRQLPPLAYFSLLVIWLGIDESPKIWLLVIAAMPPVAVATAAAVSGVHRDHLNAARSLGAGRWDLVRRIVLPAALPEIIVGIRIGVGVAYTSVVAAETVNGVPGIGGMIRDAQRYNQTDTVILGIVLLGISGLLLDAGLRQLQVRAAPWRGRE